MAVLNAPVAGETNIRAFFPNLRLWTRAFTLFALIVLAAGCAQVPKQAFNKEAHGNLKRIAVLEPAKPESYAVYIAHHPGASFGLIGGIIAAADMQSKTDGFTGKMKELDIDFANILTTSVEEELRKANYDVVRHKPERQNQSLLDNYANLSVDADAYLDWVINWNGFIAATATSDYLPSVRVYVRLVQADTKAVLYSELIGYGYQHGGGQPIELAAEPNHRYGSYSSLMERAPVAAEGLKAGAPLIARQISTDLAR